MKKYLSGVVTGLLLALMSLTVIAAVPGIQSAEYTEEVSILVDGVKQEVEVISVVKEGEVWARNYVSVGDLGPALGAEVIWNGETQTVELIRNGNVHLDNENLDISTDINDDSDEWISLRDFSTMGTRGVTATNEYLYIYDNMELDNLLVEIDLQNNTSPIRIEMTDNATLLNKSDLIEAGILEK